MNTAFLRSAFTCVCGVALWSGCTSWEAQTDAYVLSPGFEEKLEQVNFQFNRNRFDSVGTLLLVMESQTNTPLEKYLMACYQAEVLYYNLLPKPAIANLDAAMEIAKASGKPELVANCENYYALFHIIDQKPREAQVHLWRAKSLLPADTAFEFLVNDYQILSNLGEVHLMLHNSDSALHYARQSQALTQARNIERGTVLNHWILGQVYLQKNRLTEAEQAFTAGLKAVRGERNGDVLHYLYAGLIECARRLSRPNEAEYWIRLGQDSALVERSTLLAQTDFYRQASAAADHFGNKDLTIQLEKEQLRLTNEARERELVMQANILSLYFERLNNIKLHARGTRLMNRFIQTVLALLVLGAGIVFVVNRKILRQKITIQRLESESAIALLRKEKEISEIIARNTAVEQERSRISKELHDDIGSSVSSIKIYNNLALHRLDKEPEKTKELLEKSVGELKQIEESLGDLIWAVYTKDESLQNLLMRMKQYGFDVLSAKDIQAGFHYPAELEDIPLPMDFRKNILLIFKEFVNNTAKYSQAHTFSLSVSHADGPALSIILADDGIGFCDDVQTGKGLSNIRSRAAGIDPNFLLASEPGEGVTLRMTYHLPIHQV